MWRDISPRRVSASSSRPSRTPRTAEAGPRGRDMKSARDRLAVEHQRALEHLADLRRDFDSVVAASRDTNADDEHDPEGSTIAFERSQIESLVRRAEHHLEEIDAAVTRVDTGTY